MKKCFMPVLLGSIMFSSCGGDSSGGGDSSTVEGEISSTFIDAPVKGLQYVREYEVDGQNVEGTTGEGGAFKCIAGEMVDFKLAGLILGHAYCGEKIFVDELTDDSGSFNSGNAAAAIIQTFAENNSEELDLTNFNATSIDLSDKSISAPVTDDTELTNLMNSLGSAVNSYTPPSYASMRAHVEQYLPSLSSDAAISALTAKFDGVASNTNSYMNLSQISGGEDCWENISLLVKVESHGNTFKVQALRSISHDGYDISTITTCEDTDNYDCDPESKLPPAKIMTSRELSVVDYEPYNLSFNKGTAQVCGTEEDYTFNKDGCGDDSVVADLDKDYSYQGATGYTLKMEVKDDGISVQLSDSYLSVSLDESTYSAGSPGKIGLSGKKVTCKYSLSE